MTERRCASGKAGHRSLRVAKAAARIFARRLAEQRELVVDLYAYRCEHCPAWHLTRRSEWPGDQLAPAYIAPVYIAPPEETQRWAWGE